MSLLKKRDPELVRDDLVDLQPESPSRPRVIVSLDRSWYHLLGLHRLTYYRLLHRHRAIPVRVDYGEGPEPEDIVPIARDFIAQGDALLLSGGADIEPRLYGSTATSAKTHPRRDRFELALIEAAVDRGLPILGICRGCQLINVALGGTLFSFNVLERMKRRHSRWRIHPVEVVENTHLHKLLQTDEIPAIRSGHTQAIARPADSLTISGWSTDGIPEAIESRSHDDHQWIVGVQWHPELMFFERYDDAIIRDFVAPASHHAIRVASVENSSAPTDSD